MKGFETSLITLLDVHAGSSVPDRAQTELRELLPAAKAHYLKRGGKFPYLANAEEYTLGVRVHLRRHGYGFGGSAGLGPPSGLTINVEEYFPAGAGRSRSNATVEDEENEVKPPIGRLESLTSLLSDADRILNAERSQSPPSRVTSVPASPGKAPTADEILIPPSPTSARSDDEALTFPPRSTLPTATSFDEHEEASLFGGMQNLRNQLRKSIIDRLEHNALHDLTSEKLIGEKDSYNSRGEELCLVLGAESPPPEVFEAPLSVSVTSLDKAPPSEEEDSIVVSESEEPLEVEITQVEPVEQA